MPASQGRSSEGVASIGGLASGRMDPARTSTVRVPAPVSQARSTASRTSSPLRSRSRTSPGSRSVAAITTTTCESALPANERNESIRSGCAPSTSAGPTPLRQPGATRRPHKMTMPGPCHSSSRRPMSRQAARELSVGSGGRSRSPITSTRRPRATRMVRSVPVAGSGILVTVSTSPFMQGPSCHLRSVRPLLREGDSIRLRGESAQLSWTFVPANPA